MEYAASGELAGFRSGTKNGKRWGNVFIDDPMNPMQRTQLFVNDDLIDLVGQLPVRSLVVVTGRIYSVNNGNGFRITLESIKQK